MTYRTEISYRLAKFHVRPKCKAESEITKGDQNHGLENASFTRFIIILIVPVVTVL